MEKKWNLQDIRPAGERKKRTVTRTHVQSAPVETAPEQVRPREQKISTSSPRRASSSKGKKPFMLVFAILAVILIPGFLIGFLLDGAQLTVEPRVREPNVNGTFTAYREPRAGELSYEVMTLEAEGERRVPASGQEEVEEQATGQITIYNSLDSSERLIKNTRFESPEGLIFRITESVIVPAATDGTPGSVQATVFADEPGENYNIGPSDFTIPGYEEGGYTELFNGITARSTTAMTGGFAGVTFVVEDAALADAKKAIHDELQEALLARVEGERPAGFIMIDEATTFTYESQPSVEAGEGMVTVKEKALLHVPLFAADAFAMYLASATVPGYEGEPVRIESMDTLTFSYTASSTEATDIRAIESFDFELSGKPLIVWSYDADALRNDLAGAAKTALPTILGGYPAIERAEAVIRPFWKGSFPDAAEEIEIEEILNRPAA